MIGKPNCLKIVCNINGVLSSVWSKASLGEFHRFYEIGKPTYPKEGSLLFCYLLNEEIFSKNMFFPSGSSVYVGYATDLKPFEIKENFSSVPIESEIKEYWENTQLPFKKDDRSDNFARKNWALASSITLLELLK